MLIPQKKYRDAADKLPLYGIYEAQAFEWDKDSLKNTVYALPWKTLMIETEDHSVIKFADDSKDQCKLTVDTVQKKIGVVFDDDLKTIHRFFYRIPSIGHLEISGSLYGNPVNMKFKKQKSPLTETGFNWVNEYPNNR